MVLSSMTALGPRIAEGKQAEVFLWGEAQVIKLFRDQRPRSWVEYEARTARAVHAAGVPAPAVGEIVELDGRFGLIYERVEGRPLGERVLSRPWTMGRYARFLAELQAKLHAVSAPPELPSQHDRLRRRLLAASALPPRLQQAALAALDDLPGGEALCHADFNLFNILMTARGPIIIDWNDSARGDPLSDLAWTWVMAATGEPPWWLEPLKYWLSHAYRRRALQLHATNPARLRLWTGVAAAAPVADGIPRWERWAIRLGTRALLR